MTMVINKTLVSQQRKKQNVMRYGTFLSRTFIPRPIENKFFFFAIFMLLLQTVDNSSISQTVDSLLPVKGIRITDGFKITKAAGDELATNVFCMAVNAKGETFVSGPGYIKTLIDSDGDGQFDKARTFANGPASGAQGMCFDGNDVLCTGDGGLLRFVDANDDGVADGKPEMIFPIRTGSEHRAHAIRKGPDGWWYVLAGNQTGALPEYFAGKNSPIKNPRAGFVLRVSPDWSEKEIVCHGFRNAYDFDFNSLGQIFVYDSDGERDINLPWYRPTRLFEMRPGDDAGWVSAGWKRDSGLFDMPIEVGSFGRGSPTGVVASDSKQFPVAYDDALFFADWTLGRVLVCKRNSDGSYDSGSDFAIANGQFGFAVTDLDFDADGSLLISVGGRGTEGGVYRVAYTGERAAKRGSATEPNLAGSKFLKKSKSGRLAGKELVKGLTSSNKSIQNYAAEALVGRRDIFADESLKADLVKGLKAALKIEKPQQFKRLGTLLRVLDELAPAVTKEIDKSSLPVESKLLIELAAAKTDEQKKSLLKMIGKELAVGKGDPLTVARIGQLVLGGCGEKNADQMFVGYTARNPLMFSDDDLRSLCSDLALALKRPGQRVRADVDNPALIEIGRLGAMLKGPAGEMQQFFANSALIGMDETDVFLPTATHWLNCFAQTSPGVGEATNHYLAATASLLRKLNQKMHRHQPAVDRNFYPRLRTLVKTFLANDDSEQNLANSLASSLSGLDEEVYLFELLPAEVREKAAERFAAKVSEDLSKATIGQVRILASHPQNAYQGLIRKLKSRKDLRGVVLSVLNKKPIEEDRKLFLDGLVDSNLTTIKQSAIGLRRLGGQPSASEVVAAVWASKRLSWDKPAVSVRDQLMLLLQKRSAKTFGYQPKKQMDQSKVIDEWTKWAKANFPEEFAAYQKNNIKVTMTPKDFAKRLSSVPWDSGDVKRGAAIYQKRQCAQCHDLGSRMGPRLEGLSKRFGRDDVFRAIVNPNEQVPDRYRAIFVESVDGKFYRGSVVYESVDGITLQESNGTTVRINREDIESRTKSAKSLMPEGLMDGSTDQDWADLYEYLKSR